MTPSVKVQDWQSAPATTLAFDPSCAEEGVLRSINQQARPDTGDAVPSSSPGSLSFDPSSGSAPLEAEHGPSTSGSNMPFTPRSDDIKLLGKMLRSDLAAEVRLTSRQQAAVPDLLPPHAFRKS